MLGAERAFACSCIMPEGSLSKLVGDAKKSSDAIFSGRVLKITENPNAERMQYQYLSVELKVVDTWKGTIGKTVIIRTGSNDGNCRYPFKVGETYLIYAENSTMYSPTKFLSASVCSRTTPLAEGKPDIRFLGKRRRPK